MTTFHLIRHGTTAWVDQQLLHGITDIPLNENGLRQAQKAAQAMRGISAQHLFTSPLSRALQTAQVIGEMTGLTPQPLPGLKEINFGWMEGRKIRDDAQHSYPAWVRQMDHQWMSLVRLLSGESLGHFKRRIAREWQNILALSEGQDAFIVAHSGVLSALLTILFGDAYLGEDLYYILYPCSITEFTLDETGRANLVRLNEHAHLGEWYPHAH